MRAERARSARASSLWGHPQLHQFARFCVVGLIQNGVNVAIFALAVAEGVSYLLSSAIAACFALALSFLANRHWTFSETRGRGHRQAVRYISIWMVVLLVGLPELALLVSVVHLPKVLAQTVVIAVGAPISYLAQRRWTFSARPS